MSFHQRATKNEWRDSFVVSVHIIDSNRSLNVGKGLGNVIDPQRHKDFH